MIWTLRTVLSTTSNKNLTIICLNWTESNWYSKILEKLLPSLTIIVYIIVCNIFLIKFKEMNTIVLELWLSSYHLFLYQIMVSRPHFWSIYSRSLRSSRLIINSYKLSLGLTLLITPLTLETLMNNLRTLQWSLLSCKTKITVPRMLVAPVVTSFRRDRIIVWSLQKFWFFKHCNFIQIDVWEIHYKIFSHKSFVLYILNYIEFTMIF